METLSPSIDSPKHKITPVDSATESDEDVPHRRNGPEVEIDAARALSSPSPGPSNRSPEPRNASPKQNNGPLSDSDSSPKQPAKKKQKHVSSSDNESPTDSQKQGRGGAPVKRGTRQPIKRGGKRF
jgi:hypothetical protein